MCQETSEIEVVYYFDWLFCMIEEIEQVQESLQNNPYSILFYIGLSFPFFFFSYLVVSVGYYLFVSFLSYSCP